MKLLSDLYAINSKSNQEGDITAFILEWLAQYVPNAKCRIDNAGNMYITKGESETYPVIAAHLDK